MRWGHGFNRTESGRSAKRDLTAVHSLVELLSGGLVWVYSMAAENFGLECLFHGSPQELFCGTMEM